MKVVIIIARIAAGVPLLARVGLQVKPRPFPVSPQKTPEMQIVPLPEDLSTLCGEVLPAALQRKCAGNRVGCDLRARQHASLRHRAGHQ